MDTDKRVVWDEVIYRVPPSLEVGEAIQEQFPPTGKTENDKAAYKILVIEDQQMLTEINDKAFVINKPVDTSHIDPDSRD